MRLMWRGAARLVRTVLGAERLCRTGRAGLLGERRTGERAAASARAWSRSMVATGGGGWGAVVSICMPGEAEEPSSLRAVVSTCMLGEAEEPMVATGGAAACAAAATAAAGVATVGVAPCWATVGVAPCWATVGVTPCWATFGIAPPAAGDAVKQLAE